MDRGFGQAIGHDLLGSQVALSCERIDPINAVAFGRFGVNVVERHYDRASSAREEALALLRCAIAISRAKAASSAAHRSRSRILNKLISGAPSKSHRHAIYVGYSTIIDEIQMNGRRPQHGRPLCGELTSAMGGKLPLACYRHSMDVTIDFVAFDPELDAWLLVLVEPGPWNYATAGDRLVALQDRLYGCLEAAFDGQIAERFPEAADAKVIVRADCYDCYGTARDEVDAFIQRFSAGVRDMPDFSPASSPWVRSFEVEVAYDQIH